MKVNPDDFTEGAWQGIIDAKDLALSKKHQTLETEHLFYCLIKNRQIQLLLKKTCVESIVLSGSFLIIKINKNSFYYNKAFLFSMNSFFKKNKINTIKKTDSLEYKIQFKKTVMKIFISSKNRSH